MPKRVVFLFSDTGGGHRSLVNAVAEALARRAGAGVSTEPVDVFRSWTPFPFNRAPDFYPHWLRWAPGLWSAGFWLTNGRGRVAWANALLWALWRRRLASFAQAHPADLYIGTHPILAAAVIRALGPGRPPVWMIVGDTCGAHAWWFNGEADQTLVATRADWERALACGLRPDQVRLTGLPLAAEFTAPAQEPAQLRARLGWDPRRPAVLVVGGADGVGPLAAITAAIAASGLECQVAVVAGRNRGLYESLRGRAWPLPVHVYGYTREMAALVTAADLVVTKAGPNSVAEACALGRPLILCGRVPGTEDGNVRTVVDAGAGFWAPRPAQVVAALSRWIGPRADPDALRRAAAKARSLARPRAADEIANLILERLAGAGPKE